AHEFGMQQRIRALESHVRFEPRASAGFSRPAPRRGVIGIEYPRRVDQLAEASWAFPQRARAGKGETEWVGKQIGPINAVPHRFLASRVLFTQNQVELIREQPLICLPMLSLHDRSEERRVGKACRSGW